MTDEEIIPMLRRAENLWHLAAYDPDRFRAELPLLAQTLAAEGHPPHVIAKLVRDARGCLDLPHLHAIGPSPTKAA